MRRAPRLLVVLLVLAGCYEAGANKKAPPPSSAYSYDRDYFSDEDRKHAESFKNFEDFATFVGRSSALTIYEGLPHNHWESDLRHREKKTKKTIQIEGDDFYSQPVSPAPSIVEEIKRLSASKSSFVPYRGYKLCGGFHPDWCLVWSDGSTTYTALLCFGCSEMIVMHEGKSLIYCDLWDESDFEALLNPLHINRPKEEQP